MKKLLSEKGYDPTMGARPLRRAITKYIEDPISEEIIRKRNQYRVKRTRNIKIIWKSFIR